MDPWQPYQNPTYQAQAPWANANTYAPWQAPNGQTGQNSFSGMSGTDAGPDMFGLPTSPNSQRGDVRSWDFGEGLKGALGWWDFKGGKKRIDPNFSAPSYQGTLFTPQEGLPQWYSPSAQGQTANTALQSAMYPQAQSNPMQTQSTGAPGMGYSQPNFIGQTPWLGDTVNNYAPTYGSNSYGGYQSYGGYGSSGNSGKMSSPYQPYVPTGASGLGQY